jgi:hypothetical protein
MYRSLLLVPFRSSQSSSALENFKRTIATGLRDMSTDCLARQSGPFSQQTGLDWGQAVTHSVSDCYIRHMAQSCDTLGSAPWPDPTKFQQETLYLNNQSIKQIFILLSLLKAYKNAWSGGMEAVLWRQIGQWLLTVTQNQWSHNSFATMGGNVQMDGVKQMLVGRLLKACY